MLTKSDLQSIRELMEEVMGERIVALIPGMIDDGINKTVPGMIQSALVPVVRELSVLRGDVDEIKERNRFLPTTDVFLEWIDKVYGELQEVREDQELQVDWGERLHDVEERVLVVEKCCGVTSG